MTETKTITRVAQIHDSLRADILRGDFAPGEPLRLAALAAKYDTSMSVVREALARLAEHNLAVLTPNQGFRVVDVSRADFTAITELRQLLEGEALRNSIKNGDVQWEAAVISAHHVLERATYQLEDEPGTTQEWSDAHAAFHLALVSASGNPRMLALTNMLRDVAEIYRQLSKPSAQVKERDIAGEHRELMELATARNLRAVDALRSHLQRTFDGLREAGVL